MKLKFTVPYADADNGFKAGSEYDFIDAKKAAYFIDRGIAVPVEQATPARLSPKDKAGLNAAVGAVVTSRK